MIYQAINFVEKFAQFDDVWSPKVIAQMNDYQFKVVKLEGEFVFHSHADTDEVFWVLEGQLRIEFNDGHVDLAPGEMFVVPKGVEHKPVAKERVHAVIIEPHGVINTGDARGSQRTAPNDVWI